MASMYTPEEIAEINARAADEIKRLGAVSTETKMAMMDISVGIKGFTSSLTKGFGQLGSSALGLTKQLADGEIGASVFNNSIGGVANALGDLLGLIPYVGGALKTLVKGASEYTQAVNKQADLLYSNYQKMSEMGATAAGGMQGVYDNLKRMNYGTDELDKFVSIVKENSATLAQFGGTVSQGLGQMAAVSQSMKDTGIGTQFQLMGISVDEMNKGIASYNKMQMLTGVRQKMSTEEQATAAANYIKEIDLLAKVTGKSRAEQEAAQESAMAEERFAAYKIELEQKAAAGDKAAAAQLEQVNRTQQQLDKMAPETRKGFLNILSGTINTPEAQKLFLSFPQAAALASKKMLDTNEFMDTLQGEAQKNLAGSQLQQAKIGANNDKAISIQETQRLANMKAGGPTKERFEEAGKGQKVEDPNTAAMVKIQEKNRASRDNLQDLLNAGIGPVTTGMQGLATATDATIEGMTKMANSLGVVTKKRDEPPKQPPAPPAPAAPPPPPLPLGFGPGKRAPVTAEDYQEIERQRKASAPPPAPPPPAAPKPAAPASAPAAPKPAAPASAPAAPKPAAPASAPAAPPPVPAAAKPAAPKPVAPAAAPASSESGKAIPKPTPKEPEGSGAASEKSAEKSADLSKILKFTARSGSQQNFEALNSTFKNSVTAAATEYNKLTGGMLTINSAKRDPADQQRIWDESVAAGRPGIGPKGMPIGKPGRSLHERGEAIDIQEYNNPIAVSALNKYGLTQKVPRDPVHFQAKDGGIVPPLPGGSTVLAGEAGQSEAVVPLPDGKTIPVQAMGNQEQVNMMSSQLIKLDEIARIMQNQLSVSQKLLKFAQ